MKLYLAKTGLKLVAADDDAEIVIQRLGDGEVAEFRIVRPRSLQWHRMYFGICSTIAKNQDPQRDEDSIDCELRIRSGHFYEMMVDGHRVRWPKRIAFEKLTADEWADLWPRLELAIRETFGETYLEGVAA